MRMLVILLCVFCQQIAGEDTTPQAAGLAAAAAKVQAAQHAVEVYVMAPGCPDHAFAAEQVRLTEMSAKLAALDAEVQAWAVQDPGILAMKKEQDVIGARRSLLWGNGTVKKEDEAEFKKNSDAYYWLIGAQRTTILAHETPAHRRLRHDVECLRQVLIFTVRNKLTQVAEAKALADAYRAAEAEQAAAQSTLYRAQGVITAVEWLKSQPKPSFRAGTSLPRLTRYGWVLPFETRRELTENWGYALEFGGYVGQDSVDRLDNPFSDETRIVELAKADAKRYPLAVICSREMPGTDAPLETWVRGNDGKVLNAQAKSMDGTTWSEASGAIFSPEAPPVVWKLAGACRADSLIALQKRGVPLSIVLNGGEYGVGILGQMQPLWAQDPAIRSAVAAEPYKGNWQDYASEKKAKAERAIADVVRAAVPKRDLYVYYTAGGGTLRNKYWGQGDWGYQWRHCRGISDLPSSEIYFKAFNDGFTGHENMLSMALNATALEIASGDNISYNWICAGWGRGNPKEMCADLTRWTGFLKCYYTAGMVGANVGYYELPPGGFAAPFPANNPPEWLKQMVASAHVHALFSQVDDLIRNGDLLPGTMPHGISPTERAFEFPTGDETLRVLVRKQRVDAKKKTVATWLVTAWASDGTARPATVMVPELGRLSLEARGCGSVYRATLADGKVTLVQLDGEGATFTHVKNTAPVVSVVDLSLPKPSATGLLLWLSADSGVAKDANGKVTAWKSSGKLALSLVQPNAAKAPELVAAGIAGKPALRFTNVEQWLAVAEVAKVGKSFVGPLTVFTVATTIPKGDVRILSAGAACEGSCDYIDGRGFKITADGPADIAQGPAALKSRNARLDTPLAGLTIGNSWNGQGYAGDVAEVLIYAGVLAPTQATLVQDYLNQKYHLTP
ncbi:MAG: hypothetical protein H0X38_02860 [Planctomycetes bacterium]|nr:hypothetical protein [Planctomycetota bacterium]